VEVPADDGVFQVCQCSHCGSTFDYQADAEGPHRGGPMKLSPTMLAVLAEMAGGVCLQGSGLGKAVLRRPSGPPREVRAQTHMALIQGDLVRRVPHSQQGNTFVWDWMISDAGRQAVEDARAEGRL